MNFLFLLLQISLRASGFYRYVIKEKTRKCVNNRLVTSKTFTMLDTGMKVTAACEYL